MHYAHNITVVAPAPTSSTSLLVIPVATVSAEKMRSFPDDIVDEAAAASLVWMNSQQLSSDDCHQASEALFNILSEMTADDFSKKIEGFDGIEVFKPTMANLAIPLASPSDSDILSPLQCYIRAHCVEYFEATLSDVSPSRLSADFKNSSKSQQQRGRRSPIVLGRIGIRCVYCKHCPYNLRASQSTSFPSNLDKIYSAVVMWQCRHAPHCREMPKHVREHLSTLKRGGGNGLTGGTSRNELWSTSARDLGFANTDNGIRFLPPDRKYSPTIEDQGDSKKYELTQTTRAVGNSCTNATGNTAKLITPKPAFPWVVSPDESIALSNLSNAYNHLIQGSQLVSVHDSVPAYIAVAFAQLKRCHLTSEDQAGPFKSRDVGFLGLCCKWCEDEPGRSGRYFPNKSRSLSQTTTVKAIVKHVCSCSKCPKYITDVVHALSPDIKPIKQATSSSGDTTKCNHVISYYEYGSKTQFFENVWNRLHGNVPLATNVIDSSGMVGHIHLNLFRPIQDPVSVGPVMEYESLQERNLDLHNGRRVSVYVAGLTATSLSARQSTKKH